MENFPIAIFDNIFKLFENNNPLMIIAQQN